MPREDRGRYAVGGRGGHDQALGHRKQQQSDGRLPAAIRRLRLHDGVSYFPLLRSEEHTSELQSLMRISYAVFCLKKKKTKQSTSQDIPNRLTNITTTTPQ